MEQFPCRFKFYFPFPMKFYFVKRILKPSNISALVDSW
jgi:hypothetical protein